MSHLTENFYRAAQIVRHGFAAIMGKTFAGIGPPAARRKTAGTPGREAPAVMLYRIKIDGHNVRQMKIFLPDFLKYSYKRIDFHEFL
ncbi:MAG: hypothetical protein ACI3VX_08435 [Faecousia sp.]